MNQSIYLITFFLITFLGSTIKPLTIVHGSWSEQGDREKQQDRYANQIFNLEDRLVHCIGIFDGHGVRQTGHLVAEYAQEHLLNQLAPAVTSLITENNLTAIPDTIQKLFQNFNKNLKDSSPGFVFNNGTTATTIIIVGEHCIVANVGDSMAYLQKSNNVEPLTEDHRLDEKFCEQIKETKTAYLEKKVIKVCSYQDFPFKLSNFIKRLYPEVKLVVRYEDDGESYCEGLFSMSRTLGSTLFCPHVTAFPFVQHFILTVQDKFIVLASDGLWDNMTGRAAAKFVLHYLQENHIDIETITSDQAQTVAQALVHASLKISPHDNTTATIIFFNTDHN